MSRCLQNVRCGSSQYQFYCIITLLLTPFIYLLSMLALFYEVQLNIFFLYYDATLATIEVVELNDAVVVSSYFLLYQNSNRNDTALKANRLSGKESSVETNVNLPLTAKHISHKVIGLQLCIILQFADHILNSQITS